MKQDQWMQHFVEVTEKRFDQMELKNEKKFDQINTKLDTLLRFKWQIIGGSLLASFLLTGFIQIYTKL